MENDKALEYEKQINRYIAEREPLDLTAVYEQLKDEYPLILTNTFSMPNGAEDYQEDFMILCGESDAGAFQLYDNGLYIIFDADKSDGTYTHWHPSCFDDAVNDVINFMKGEIKQ